jgi:transcriptional antiterminator NusG
MADNNVKWYVVRGSGQENKVKAYIETEISRLEMELCFSSSCSYK